MEIVWEVVHPKRLVIGYVGGLEGRLVRRTGIEMVWNLELGGNVFTIPAWPGLKEVKERAEQAIMALWSERRTLLKGKSVAEAPKKPPLAVRRSEFEKLKARLHPLDYRNTV